MLARLGGRQLSFVTSSGSQKLEIAAASSLLDVLGRLLPVEFKVIDVDVLVMLRSFVSNRD